MKLTKILLGVIALVAVIGFLALPLMGCSSGDEGGGGSTGGGNTGGGTGNSTIPKEIEMLPILAGTFIMGSPESEPNRENNETQHSVTLTNGFYMSKYLVTQAQWVTVMGASEDRTFEAAGKGDDYPIYYVSWYDAIVFCNKLSIKEGKEPVYSINSNTNPANWGAIPTTNSNATWDAAVMDKSKNGYRLPTEAEWEYVCRAGTTTAYNTGATISDSTGWYASNSGNKTHEVGLKLGNAWGFGLYDMHGNVFEWCWDWYGQNYYSSSPANEPLGASSRSYRVIRGGSHYNEAKYLRSAFRGFDNPSYRNWTSGFRVVRSN